MKASLHNPSRWWSHRVAGHAGLLGALAIPYALYLARDTVHRSAVDDLNGVTVVVWALATTVPLFAMLGGAAAAVGLAVARWWPGRRRDVAAAVVHGGLLTCILTWAYVNQAVDYYSGEALTFGTLHFIWENATEVFQTTWKLARWRLGGVGVGMAVGFVVLPWVVHRFNRSPWVIGPNGTVRRHRPGPCAAAATLALLCAGGGLGMQFVGDPSPALVELSRTAPPLRFLDLTRRLVHCNLRTTIPEHDGAPIESDDAYAASLVVDAQPARNVLLILLESVPAMALSCYGYERNVTPNIDRLASEGFRFENCIATASFSAYGQISIFTSQYMLRGERNDHFRIIRFPFKCLHSVLGLRGYEVAAISSANEGFENIDAFLGPEQFDVWYTRNTAPIPESEQWDANRMDDKHAVAEFAHWIASRRRDRPFFCYMNLQSTHFDYWIPEPWASHYQPTLPWLSSGNGIVRIPPEQVEPLRNQFDNALRYLDHFVGRIREAVEGAGYGEDTILVLVGDHGEAFMEHGTARHGMHLYQEVIHVPLILHAPGAIEPRRIGERVSQIDIAPTVAGLLGLRPHPSWQGVDVSRDDYRDEDRPVYSVLQLSRMQEAVILNDWKYIFDLTDCRESLFDLERDPEERVNRVRSDAGRAAELRRVLSAFHTHQVRYHEDPALHTRRYVGRAPVTGPPNR